MMGSRFLRQLDLHDLLSLDQDSRPYPAIRRSPESWEALVKKLLIVCTCTSHTYVYSKYARARLVKWSGQTRPARPIQCYGTCSDCGRFTLFCKLRGFNLLYNLMWLDLVHSPTVMKLCTTVSRVLPISRIWRLGEKLYKVLSGGMPLTKRIFSFFFFQGL